MFIERLWTTPDLYVSWVVIVIFSVCIHELSHVYAALSQGDDTAVRRGFLTLDPLKLMGRSSLIALAFIGIAWGRVPVTLSRFRHRYSHALVSAAGPGANVALALIFTVVAALAERFAPTPETARAFYVFFSMGAMLNCALAILNILPVPMLDGWEVAVLFAPQLNRIPQEQRMQGGWIALMVLFLSPAGRWLWVGAHALAGGMADAVNAVLPAVG